MHYIPNIRADDNMSSSSRGSSDFIHVSEEQEIQIFAKQLLMHRLFVGHYQERRYVDTLSSYRDVIVVHDTEDKLERDLETVKKRFQSFYRNDRLWIGITGPKMIGAPAGVCVWVKLQNLAFGHYWFQIRKVKFLGQYEVCLQLKCVRPVNPEVLIGGPSVQQKTSTSPTSEPTTEPEQEERPPSPKPSAPPEASPASLFGYLMNNGFSLSLLMSSFVSLMTLDNAKSFSSFTAVLLVACVTGLVHLVGYIGDLTVRLMREISNLIHVLMPLLLAIIDFVTKCVGGLYILIAMMWRGTPPPASAFSKGEPRMSMLEYRSMPPARKQYMPPPPPWQYRKKIVNMSPSYSKASGSHFVSAK